MKTKVLSLLKIIIIFSCIFITSGYALTTIPGNKMLTYGALAIVIVVAIVSLIVNRIFSFTRKDLGLLVTWAIIIMVPTIINYNSINRNSAIFLFALVLVAFIITKLISFSDFKKYFIIAMQIIALINLVFYFLTTILKMNFNVGHVVNVNGAIFQNFYIWFRAKVLVGYSERTMGIFWEPGLFATYLCVALLLELITKKKVSLFNVVLFIASIIITKSTAGYVLLVLVLLAGFFHFKGRNSPLMQIVAASLLVGLVVLYVFLYPVFLKSTNPILHKLAIFDVWTSISRIGSMQANIEVFKNSPLFGNGLGNAGVLYLKVMNDFNTSSQTSTTFFYLAAFGVPGLLFTFIFVVSFIKMGISENNFFKGLILAVITLLILNKEPHHEFLFVYIMWFYIFNAAFVKSGVKTSIRNKRLEQ